VVEEGQPEFIEQALRAALHKAGRQCGMHGKDMLPMAGEYTGQVMLDGVEAS
jgi:indolepyruvate ferredoxin oxidoreductase alpha subunit